MIGKTISHYRIQQKLGGGGMGVVYAAEDTRLGRRVAIKFLPEKFAHDHVHLERFRREARAASALNHPNICTIHDLGQEGDQPFIVMELLQGQTLKHRMDGQALELDEVLTLAVQIADALCAAHSTGIVHRDIKPSNLFVTQHGDVKVLDFGIAKQVTILESRQEETLTSLTAGGVAPGTLAYMSPEQVRGLPVDARCDIFSFGVVLHEMVTGIHPFARATPLETATAILSGNLPTFEQGPIPTALKVLLNKVLEVDPDQRCQSVGAILKQLRAQKAEPGPRVLWKFLQRKSVAVSLLGVILVLLALASLPSHFSRLRENARALLADAASRARDGEYARAFDLAVQAQKHLDGNDELAGLLPIISDNLTVMTQPEGARVYLQRIGSENQGKSPRGSLAGVTPIRDLRIARSDYRTVVDLGGYRPLERIVSSEMNRAMYPPQVARNVKIEATLVKSEDLPEDMVAVPGGDYHLVGWGAPTAASVQLESFLIDKYEVSNVAFKQFIQGGGYRNQGYWKFPLLQNGRTLSWKKAMSKFVDRSGLPAPRSWINQDWPSGKGNHPVADVTWYEAAAYCEFMGKGLPSVFQWEKTARNGLVTPSDGIVMPWGLVTSRQVTRDRADFGGVGTVPVNFFPFGISPFGSYNMAGNVKEWNFNRIDEGFAATGASWQDAIYQFPNYAALDGLFSSSSLGFRCVQNKANSNPGPGFGPIESETRIPVYEPVPEETFKIFLRHYKYDKRPPAAEVIEQAETADWSREKVTFNGLDGDRVLAYLYLPKDSKPPYQCLIFVPSSLVFFGRSVSDAAERTLSPQIKSGRAVLAVVLKGMTERVRKPGYTPPDYVSVRFREEMVLHATELSLALDYLETREDIDSGKLAYVGKSWGAGSRLVFAALEDRYRTVVLIGAGIDLGREKTIPEANLINFAPYIRPPKLMLNGRFDEEEVLDTEALPLYKLLRQPKKLVLLDEGHIPSLETRTPIINQWLDSTLGPPN